MTIRERVVLAYGAQCAWCFSCDELEIDHVYSGGNVHRKQIRIPLATWLAQQYRRLGYWLAGYELLCRTCHQKKTRLTVPAAEGKRNLNVAIPDRLIELLEKRASDSQYAKSKSLVITDALEAFLQGTPELTALDQLHNHISKAVTDILGVLQASQTFLEAQMQAHQTALHTMATVCQRLEQRLEILEHQQTELVAGYDRLKATIPRTKGGLWRRSS